jgi:molybdate transport repressor ModE-like protein
MILKAKTSVWLENERGQTIMDPEIYQILKAIYLVGSMSKAAEKVRKQFRRVWGIVKETEAVYGRPLVETGPNGSRLTEEGYRLLVKYEELAKTCKRSANTKFRKIFYF